MIDPALTDALNELFARQCGEREPDGVAPVATLYGNGYTYYEPRFWTPSTREHQTCCDSIPARGDSLKRHCLGAAHVARLFGVRPDDLARAATRLRRQKKLEAIEEVLGDDDASTST